MTDGLKKLHLVCLIFALFSLGLGYIFGEGDILINFVNKVKSKRLAGSLSVNQNSLFLTSPVTSFSGKVEKVEGENIFVSQKFSFSPNQNMIAPPVAPPAGTPPVVPPTPITKTLTYKVKVTKNTTFSRPANPVNYLLVTGTPAPPPALSAKDIAVGQTITVSSSKDLRTLTSDEFEAISINLPPITNTISGKITAVNVQNNTLVLKAMPPAGPPQQTTQPSGEVEYLITVSPQTEISRLKPSEPAKEEAIPKPPQAEKFSLSDLKVDMQATVYTDVDIASHQKFTALRIEPVIQLPTAAVLVPSPLLPTNSVPPPAKIKP